MPDREGAASRRRTEGSLLLPFIQQEIGDVPITGTYTKDGKAALQAAGEGVFGSAALFIQVFAGTSKVSSNNVSATVPQAIPLGRSLVVRIAQDFAASGGGITDTRGHTWTQVRNSANAGSTIRGGVYLLTEVTTQLEIGDTITYTLSAGNRDCKVIVVEEYLGTSGGLQLDVQNAGAGTGTAPTGVSVTGHQSPELLISDLVVEGPSTDTITLPSYYFDHGKYGTTGGVDDTNLTISTASRRVGGTNAQSLTPTLGTSRNWLIINALFRSGSTAYVKVGKGILTGAAEGSELRERVKVGKAALLAVGEGSGDVTYDKSGKGIASLVGEGTDADTLNVSTSAAGSSAMAAELKIFHNMVADLPTSNSAVAGAIIMTYGMSGTSAGSSNQTPAANLQATGLGAVVQCSSTLTGELILTLQLSATVDGPTSTVSGGTPRITRQFIAQIAGSSVVAGDLPVSRPLAAVLTTSSAVAADLFRSVFLQGSGQILASSQVAALLGVSRPLAATLLTSSELNVGLVLSQSMGATATGDSTLQGLLGLDVLLAGQSSGSSNITPLPRLIQITNLAGQADGSSTVFGSISPILQVRIDGSTAIDIDLGLIRPIAAVLSTSSLLTGVLGVSRPLGVQMSTSSTVLASAGLEKTLGATLAGTSTMVVDIRPVRQLSATLTTSSVMTGAANLAIPLQAYMMSSSSASADLFRVFHLRVDIGSLSEVVASWHFVEEFVVASHGTSTLHGDLNVPKMLSATLSGSSTLVVAPTYALNLSAALSGSSLVVAPLAGSKPLSGDLSGFSVVVGAPSVTHPLGATLSTSSTLTGNARLDIPLAVALSGGSTLSGSLPVTHPMAVQVDGASLLTVPPLVISHGMAATILTSSTITGQAALIIPLQGTGLSGSSTLTLGDFHVLRMLFAQMAGSSSLSLDFPDMDWGLSVFIDGESILTPAMIKLTPLPLGSTLSGSSSVNATLLVDELPPRTVIVDFDQDESEVVVVGP